MKDQTQPLAPLPECPLCGYPTCHDERYCIDLKWYRCENQDCYLFKFTLPVRVLIDLPDLRRIKELEEEVAQLEKRLDLISRFGRV